MPKIVVEHHKDLCIGCGACAAVCPAHWTMNGDKSKLIGAKAKGNIEVKEISEADFKCNQEAADACPVTCIFVKKV